VPPNGPLIVLNDFQVLLEVDHARFPDGRDLLLLCAELEKAPEHVHTYRLTPLSIWNARALGLEVEPLLADLAREARFPLPTNVVHDVREWGKRYGKLTLLREGDDLALDIDDDALAAEVASLDLARRYIVARTAPRRFAVRTAERGRLKQALTKAGFPVRDLAGYTDGEPLALALRKDTAAGAAFALRDYQLDAAGRFFASGTARGGSGVIVLPCGAGKTVVGLACMQHVQTSTLILTTSTAAVRQWIAELLDKTDLSPDSIGEYTGLRKEIRPVTLSTYQMLTWRRRDSDSFEHLDLFDKREWGLIIYDEVHLLPAPIFQVTASIQARRRLGLTATLVREDGLERDVFALIGPKIAEVPWKVLERSGWIAKALCTEVRVPMSRGLALEHAAAEERAKFRIAAENPAKLPLIRELLARHKGSIALVIGTYVDQLERIAAELELPLVTGKTGERRREELYRDLREGKIRALVVSKVANHSIDLPDASLAIQVSGTFGSRQEEAQRLGRILRPKSGENQAHFYALVSKDSVEEVFAQARQRFLCEQGYAYRIVAPGELMAGDEREAQGAEVRS
jgi:DNA excision repair protein ERCC-3